MWYDEAWLKNMEDYEDAYRVNSSWKSFAQNHHIWMHFLVVYSETPPGPRQACLHLISNPQHLVRKAYVTLKG